MLTKIKTLANQALADLKAYISAHQTALAVGFATGAAAVYLVGKIV